MERLQKEVQQINGVTVGIAYNIEVLLHATYQNILPHHAESLAAYTALMGTDGDGEKIGAFARDLFRYGALMMTCPGMHFVEFDFLEKLPFLIERDAALVKKAGWMVKFSRNLDNAIEDRNRQIDKTHTALTAQGGALNFHQLRSALQMQTAVANAECLNAFELFKIFLSIAESLEAISRNYPVKARGRNSFRRSHCAVQWTS